MLRDLQLGVLRIHKHALAVDELVQARQGRHEVLRMLQRLQLQRLDLGQEQSYQISSTNRFNVCCVGNQQDNSSYTRVLAVEIRSLGYFVSVTLQP